MDIIEMLFTRPGVQLIVAGGMGGIVRWISIVLTTKKMSTREGLATVLLGAILGYYASPLLQDWIGGALAGFVKDPERMPTFVAFVTGFGGMIIVGLLIDLFSKLRPPPAAKTQGNGP